LKNKNLEKDPLISIVTVVFNGEAFLEETIQNVLKQTYHNIEYIIIDGGSTDGTMDIIKKYEGAINYWLSENDKGIYDAMNKGIDIANGNWINFMNAGDKFYKNTTCSEIFKGSSYDSDIDVLYGDLIVDYGEFQRLERTRNIDNIWKGMVFSHQSAFVRTSYHKNNLYSLNYKIGGDLEFFYKTFNNDRKFKYIEKIVSIMGVDGLSDGNRFQSIWQKHQIINDYKFSLGYNMYYIYLYIDQFFRKIVKTVLPISLINIIKKKGFH
jgi:glycosyltransferase involved in cell wall biosynthesis